MIAVNDLTIRAGAFRLENISFSVAAGEYAVLMGRTGAGKTTLLETICGLRRPLAGRIELIGRDVTRARPGERGVGYVPQDAALFSTMSVRENIAFSLRVRRWPEPDVTARVAELAGWMGLEPLLERRPAALSGGEAQRVALARALAFHPGVLLLDEPLSSLDETTRESMADLIKSVRRLTGVTALHITHNREEAARLADRALVLEGGAIRDAPPQQNHRREP